MGIMKRIPYITLALGALALVCGAMPAFAGDIEFSREAFGRGEIWRLWTAHLTHFGAAHLRWDVFALLLLGSMAEMKSRRDWVAAVVISAPVIVLAVWWFQPQFAVFRGLSGIDCAAYGVVAGHLLREGWRERRGFSFGLGVVACACALAKCGYEVVTGNLVFVGATDAFAAVPLAHFAGVVAGVVVVLMPLSFAEGQVPVDGAAAPMVTRTNIFSKIVIGLRIFIIVFGCCSMSLLSGCAYYSQVEVSRPEKRIDGMESAAISDFINCQLTDLGYVKSPPDVIAELNSWLDAKIVSEWRLYDETIRVRLYENEISVRITPGPYVWGGRARIEKIQDTLAKALKAEFPEMQVSVTLQSFVNWPPP